MPIPQDCVLFYPVRLSPKPQTTSWGERVALAWDDGADGQPCADYTGSNLDIGFGRLVRERPDEAMCVTDGLGEFPIGTESIATGPAGSPWLTNKGGEVTLLFADAPEGAVMKLGQAAQPVAEGFYALLKQDSAFQLPLSTRVVIASGSGTIVEELKNPSGNEPGAIKESGQLPDIKKFTTMQEMKRLPSPRGLTIYANMVRAGCGFRNFEMGGSNGAVIHIFKGSAQIEGYDWETTFDEGHTFFKAGITPEPGLYAGEQGVILLDVSIDGIEGSKGITSDRRSAIFDRYEQVIESMNQSSEPRESEPEEEALSEGRLDDIRDEILAIDENEQPERAVELVFELMQYVKSDSPEFRLAAAAIFTKLGPRVGKFAAHIAGLLEDEDEEVRQAGREILIAAGIDPDEVVASAGNQLRDQQLGMIQLLGGQLKTFASMDMNEEQVAQVTQILGFFGQILRNEDPTIRRETIRQLGNTGAAVAPLAPQYMFLLGDPDASVRRAAVEAFRNMGVEIKLDENLGPLG